jgi:hypothetical protein
MEAQLQERDARIVALHCQIEDLYRDKESLLNDLFDARSTVRDTFAAVAMEVWNIRWVGRMNTEITLTDNQRKAIAKEAFLMADAMMAAR